MTDEIMVEEYFLTRDASHGQEELFGYRGYQTILTVYQRGKRCPY